MTAYETLAYETLQIEAVLIANRYMLIIYADWEYYAVCTNIS